VRGGEGMRMGVCGEGERAIIRQAIININSNPEVQA
jgi:hypothetical protein